MNAGDMFRVKGYDVLATANYAETGGQVIVLNNNSTHYLVAVRPNSDEEQAQFESSFSYDAREWTAQQAYRQAMYVMAMIASSR